MPIGFGTDSSGNCQMDICLNLDGLQLILPSGMELDGSSNCVAHDECSNLSGAQVLIPAGYKRGNENNCMLDLLPLKITELLPNAIGSDEGNEFIEIFNPNDSDVDLINYVLYFGSDYVHAYQFPLGSHIGAGQYLSFSNDDIKFTLVNTTSSARLSASDGTVIDETPIYLNPVDGMAWALIDDKWQYTNRPTPGAINIISYIEPQQETTAQSDLQPCADNQYRSPDTNRCRLISTTTSDLVPCKDGQYRSEETNRCRSIVTDVISLVPCAEDQERNPDTNRCRSVAVLAASDLAPCKEGQERNVDTNRCRNIVSTVPTADYAPQQTESNNNGYVGWWALAGVGALAVAYGVWEWRQEIVDAARKLGSFRRFNK
jgi:hypothetical protein